MMQERMSDRLREQIEDDGVDGTSERALYTLCLIAACHPALERELKLLPTAERFVEHTAPIVLAYASAEPGAAPLDYPAGSPLRSPAAARKLTIATSVRVLRTTSDGMKTRFRTTQRGAQSRLTDFFTLASRK
jgi:hypothetical protein